MASDELLMWGGAMFLEWFFLCNNGKEQLRILGWFSMFISSILGVWFNASGSNPFPLMVGGVLMMISMIKLTNLFTGSDDYRENY